MPFDFMTLDLPGPISVRPKVFGDARGYFFELYKHSDFAAAGIAERFVQDNYSRSAKGVLRGLHYQKPPKAQGKLVMCVRGKIFDVVVDLRKDSRHFGRWAGVELSEDNRTMLYVPAGFAHGFQALSETAEVLYKCTVEYSGENDRGVIWNDPDIAVSWPLADPILSGKDIVHPRLREADNDFIMENAQ
jgi:dTDP-4-dehydrorhamnose 3,5-epimerase